MIAVEARPGDERLFPPAAADPPTRSNAAMARDILALEFQMESGRELPVMTRFEGPITIALTGQVPPTAPNDLARVIGRFRAEAGLDVTAVPRGPASITIEFLPRKRMQALVPQAACFVVPRVSSWSEYRAAAPHRPGGLGDARTAREGRDLRARRYLAAGGARLPA